MPNQITIKKAELSDLKVIQNISKQTFLETFDTVNTPENMANYIQKNFNPIQLESEINNKNSEFYLAILKNEIVGYLKINFANAQTEKTNQNAIEIHRIYVLKDFQGKKIGQLLLDKAINIAQQKAVNYIWLGVWEENHKALQFYAKNGFETFDKHIFTLGNEQQTDLLMQLKINNL